MEEEIAVKAHVLMGIPPFRGKDNVNRVGAPEVEITKDNLPAEPEVWVLEHAL